MGFRRRGEPAPETGKTTVAKTEVKDKPVAKGSGKKTYHNEAITVFQNEDGSVSVSLNPKSNIEMKVDGKRVTGFITKDPIAELEKSVDAGRLDEDKAASIAEKLEKAGIVGSVTVVTE